MCVVCTVGMGVGVMFCKCPLLYTLYILLGKCPLPVWKADQLSLKDVAGPAAEHPGLPN